MDELFGVTDLVKKIDAEPEAGQADSIREEVEIKS
jgi:hypothetical protein